MRTLVFAVMALLLMAVSQHVHAEEELLPESSTVAAQVAIEVRFVTMPQDFSKVCEFYGMQETTTVPPAAEPDKLFSAEKGTAKGSSSIQLISSSTVVEEQLPLHVHAVDLKMMNDFIELFQRDPRTNIKYGPKVTVWDRETAEIVDVVKRPFVVDVQDGKTDVREYSEGTTLLARPTITKSGNVQLDLHVRFEQIQGVELRDKGEQQQVQSPRVKTTKFELSADLKPGEALAIWGDSLASTDGAAVPTASVASKLLRRKKFQAQSSSLMLLVKPTILAEEVAAAPK